MNLLILGYSDFIQRRVIEILLKRFKKINIAIASKTRFEKNHKNSVKWFNDYSKAINYFKPDIIYVSLPNSAHFSWAKKALKKNIHVIVDKPITLNSNQLKELIKISKKTKKLLAEATIFSFHNQIKKSVNLIGGCKRINQINANFCIPMPLKGNIKLSKKFGGGVNNDMGPYAAASFREFYKKFPTKIYVTKDKNKKIVTKLNVLAKYKHKIFFGHFSFGKEYKNEMELFSNDKIINIKSVFSPNPNLNTVVTVKTKNDQFEYIIKKESTFEFFFNLCLKKIKNKKYNFFYKTMFFDAKFRDAINNENKYK